MSTPLTGSSLVTAAIEGSADPTWYSRRPSSSDDWTSRAGVVRGALVRADWYEQLRPAFNASGNARDRLERAAAGGIAVTAGQQPGLFGGPLYTWWKALSAVSLAERLERATGLPVVPVFWAATDDGDFVEASSTVVATSVGAERISIERSGPEGASLARMPLGDVEDQLARLAAAAGSAPHAVILKMVRQAYHPGATVGGAYVALLRAMLEPHGVAVIDAGHPAVREAALPMLTDAIRKSAEIEEALLERSAALKAAGHSPQVKMVKGRTLVFRDTDGKRDRIRRSDAPAALLNPGSGHLGPNVLLRPIVERSILPTVAYLGGPGEIAYFAQVSAVADALDTPAPLILPRWSGFVIEPRIERILGRYGLAIEDFRDPHAVETRIARDSIPMDFKSKLDSLRRSVEAAAGDLSKAEGANLVSPAVIEGLKRTVLSRVERLERRLSASVKRQGNDALRDVAIARGALFPFETAQERALNVVPLIAKHGSDVFSSVAAETAKHAEQFA